LSARSPAIKELTPKPFVQISREDALALDVIDGDGLMLALPEGEFSFEVNVNRSTPIGCLGYSAGLADVPWVAAETSVNLKKDPAWTNTKAVTIITEPGVSNV